VWILSGKKGGGGGEEVRLYFIQNG
jgi:hypothetical protein